ncbi:MAG: uroporphyrinogen decarboxylase, partial [Nitrospira sp.]|nr:uroporphyrinogen decarboxylase [Nitrospira sp.]
DDAIKRLGPDAVVQGNLDPLAMFLPPEKIEVEVKEVLRRGASAKGHIFNLGHGVVPQTDPAHVIALVEMIHKHSRR